MDKLPLCGRGLKTMEHLNRRKVGVPMLKFGINLHGCMDCCLNTRTLQFATWASRTKLFLLKWSMVLPTYLMSSTSSSQKHSNLQNKKVILSVQTLVIFSSFKVFDSLECAAQAHAEDHADDLDDGNTSGHGDQVNDVIFDEWNHLWRATLKIKKYVRLSFQQSDVIVIRMSGHLMVILSRHIKTTFYLFLASLCC